ncbi:MAG: MFS transporter [Thermoprotei archaeon]
MARRVGVYSRDVSFIIASRVFRNFAAGFLNVAVGLYMYTQLHYTFPLIGSVFGAASLAAPLLNLFFGLTSDIYGRKRMLVIGNSLLVFSSLILLVSSSYYLIVLASMLGSFGLAGGTVGGGVGGYVAPMQNALLAEKAPSGERTRYFSLASLAGGVSASVGAFLTNIPDYRTLFFLGLVLSASATIIVLFVSESGVRKPAREVFKFKSGANIAKFSVTGALNGLGQGLVTPYFSVLFKSHYHVSNGLIGDIMGAATFVTALSLYFTPYLTKKFGFVKLISLTRASAAVLLALFPFAPGITLASADYFCFTALRMLSLPAQQSLMMGLVNDDERGAATAVNQASRLLPSSAGTFAAGYLFADSLELPFLVSVPVNLLNILFYNVFFKKDERKADL